jgi:putative peptidoglycan lipid II flippase
VVGIAVGIVLLPELSRALKAGHEREATHNQNRALEFALFLTLPAATAIAIMATAIVRVLYERGAFTPETTEITSRALSVFAIGLPAFVMIKVFTPGYFAREDTRTPMLFAGVAVTTNIALALTLFPLIHEAGIATAEAAAGWVNATLLFLTLRRRGHFFIDGMLLKRLPRLILSNAVMGAALWVGLRLLAAQFSPDARLFNQVGALLLLIAGGGLVYFAAAQVTGAADIRMLLRNFRRQKAGPPPPEATSGGN